MRRGATRPATATSTAKKKTTQGPAVSPGRRPRTTTISTAVTPGRGDRSPSRATSLAFSTAPATLPASTSIPRGRGASPSPAAAQSLVVAQSLSGGLSLSARGANAGNHPSNGPPTLVSSCRAPSSSVGAGARFQPNTYASNYSFSGAYSCLAVAEATGSVWCGNATTGCVEVYSAVSGEKVVTLPTLRAMHRNGHRGHGLLYTFPLSPSRLSGSAGSGGRGEDSIPSALLATATHVWVGYHDGTVAIYDVLVLQLITQGRFHQQRVVALVELYGCHVASASEDGLLVLWDVEEANFEAMTRITALMNPSREAGLLCSAVAVPGTFRLFCGFRTGDIYALCAATRPQQQAAPHHLRGHTGTIHAMAVVQDLLFSAAEDNSVCVWLCGGASGSGVPAPAAPSSGSPSGGGGPVKLLKRIAVQPCVRALFASPSTRSLWVAYADGLLERWSGNPHDDYGVEEVVEASLPSLTLAMAKGSPKATAREVMECGATVRALVAMSATQTMQVLALSSNGTNKVWYGHFNTLEVNLTKAIMALNEVIAQDTEDVAIWRERVNLLQQKESERKTKYIFILEQLSEQQVLLRFYARWKQRALFCGVRRTRESVTLALVQKSEAQLVRRYFNRWATFYDGQQRHMRRYVLCMALADATQRVLQSRFFLRWQALLVRRQVQRGVHNGLALMKRLSEAVVAGSYYHRWKFFAQSKTTVRRQLAVTPQLHQLLAHKAHRQVMQRALRQWVSYHEHRSVVSAAPSSVSAAGAVVPSATPLSRLANKYAGLQQQRGARNLLQVWRRWARRRARSTALRAVAMLREQQMIYQVRQRFYYCWTESVYASRVRAHTIELQEVEKKLRKAEAEHNDIFEKLQLQKQIDHLAAVKEREERGLVAVKEKLVVLQQSCADLQQKQLPRRTESSSSLAKKEEADNDTARNTFNSTLRSSADLDAWQRATGDANAAVALGKVGHMTANAAWYRQLVDQQRLSPIILGHMPKEEAVLHVMGQLKGVVLNLYTDLPLFRQVKDRRRGGVSAVGILLEAFGELKRLVVSSLRGVGAKGVGGRTPRWPLCMEALDSIPLHQCANVLAAIKTMIVAYDLLSAEDMAGVQSSCEEVVVNADWVFLISRACYMRRKPLPPVNNRQ